MPIAPRLQRNINPDKVCKYAILRLDKMRKDGVYDRFMDALESGDAPHFLKYLELQKIGDPEESFCIKLKDMFAPDALLTYAATWRASGLEGADAFADDIMELAHRAARMPNRKVPD